MLICEKCGTEYVRKCALGECDAPECHPSSRCRDVLTVRLAETEALLVLAQAALGDLRSLYSRHSWQLASVDTYDAALAKKAGTGT